MYLVSGDGYMKSNSRFVEEPTILQKEVDTEATREALNGIISKKIIKDYRGVSALSAYTALDLKFANWVLLVEVEEKEALTAIHTIEKGVIILGP